MSSTGSEPRTGGLPESAQPINKHFHPHKDISLSNEPDIDSNFQPEHESLEEYPEDEEFPEPPNKFKGAPSTWKSWTAADREIAVSIEQLRAKDLSIHLYNTHALKVRVRKYGGYQEIQNEAQTSTFIEPNSWEPDKYWTAWPMAEDEVPREGQDGWSKNADGSNSIQAFKHRESSSTQLEEALIGVITRKARERFREREWDDSHEDQPAVPGVESSSRVATILSPNQYSGNESTEERVPATSLSETSSSARAIENSPPSSPSLPPLQPVGDQSPPLRPTPLADDEQARALLQPSVRHILSKVDRLLFALHISRRSYLSRALESESDAQTDDNRSVASSRTSRRRGRSISKGKRRRSLLDESASDVSAEQSDATLKSDEEMISDILAEPATLKRQRALSRTSRRSSASAATRERLAEARRLRLGMRDWSDILGLAAMTGWDERVVRRASQRCRALFDEKMDFVNIPATQEEAERRSEEVDSAEEIEEGAHKDRYLQTLKPRRGWRGKGRTRGDAEEGKAEQE